MKSIRIIVPVVLSLMVCFLLLGCGNATGGGGGGGGGGAAGISKLYLAPDTSATNRDQVMVVNLTAKATEDPIIFPSGSQITAIALSPAKTKLYAIESHSSSNNQIFAIDPDTKQITAVITVDSDTTQNGFTAYMAFSPDGSKLYVPGSTGVNHYVGMYVFNITGETISLSKYVTCETLTAYSGVGGIAVSTGEGRYVYFTETVDSRMYKFDASTESLSYNSSCPAAVNDGGLTFNPAGDRLYLGGDNKDIFLMNTTDHTAPLFMTASIEVGLNMMPHNIKFTSAGTGYVPNNTGNPALNATYDVISGLSLIKIVTMESGAGYVKNVVIDETSNKAYFNVNIGFMMPPFTYEVCVVDMASDSVADRIPLPQGSNHMVGK